MNYYIPNYRFFRLSLQRNYDNYLLIQKRESYD